MICEDYVRYHPLCVGKMRSLDFGGTPKEGEVFCIDSRDD